MVPQQQQRRGVCISNKFQIHSVMATDERSFFSFAQTARGTPAMVVCVELLIL